MDIAELRRIGPLFKDVGTVILQGWGEPLLYKDLSEAVRIVKGEGAKAGFVTSGFGLDTGYITELIDAGIDFIGFSLAGATPGTHNSIRINSDFNSLIEAIKRFAEIKRDRKLSRPRLHITYLMLKENITEVPALIRLAHDIGIEEVVLINPIHITNEWQERNRAFTCDDKGDYGELMKEVALKAVEYNIRLRPASLTPSEVLVCEENPLVNLYVSAEGEVAPCVYLYPPTATPFQRIFCGASHMMDKMSFGNIFREPFEVIWNNKRYDEFRKSFTQRCAGSGDIFGLGVSGQQPLALPEPPHCCKTCHKMLGL
jgi:MoaA/NifB/PqqE/SkfB family radical SAM enzyme